MSGRGTSKPRAVYLSTTHWLGLAPPSLFKAQNYYEYEYESLLHRRRLRMKGNTYSCIQHSGWHGITAQESSATVENTGGIYVNLRGLE